MWILSTYMVKNTFLILLMDKETDSFIWYSEFWRILTFDLLKILKGY